MYLIPTQCQLIRINLPQTQLSFEAFSQNNYCKNLNLKAQTKCRVKVGSNPSCIRPEVKINPRTCHGESKSTNYEATTIGQENL